MLKPLHHPDGQIDVMTKVSHLSKRMKQIRVDAYHRWVIKGKLVTVAGTILPIDLGRSDSHTRLERLTWKKDGMVILMLAAAKLINQADSLLTPLSC